MMGRHIAKVILSSDLAAQMLFTGLPNHYWRIVNGVPPDAEFRGMAHDPVLNAIVFFYEHPTFPEVAEGHPVEKILDVDTESYIVG